MLFIGQDDILFVIRGEPNQGLMLKCNDQNGVLF